MSGAAAAAPVATTALAEHAPGASRSLVLAGNRVVAAQLARCDVALPYGLIAPARLIRREAGHGVVAMAGSEAVLLPVPADWHAGQIQLAQVVREARSDGARAKQARVTAHAGPAAPAPMLPGQIVPVHGADLLAAAGWDDVVAQATSGRIDFPGGRLLLTDTPAMLVIDVDGTGDLARLAEAAARAVAAAVQQLGIGGPLVVDFPSLGGRGPRAAVDAILAEALPPPFEKTAMNGFGLVQIVRPRGRLSLLEAARQPGFAALELLRRAMRHTGAITLSAPPAELDWLSARSALTDELARITGGRVALQAGSVAHVQHG